MVGQVVHSPACVVLVHSCVLQLAPGESWLDGIKGTGEVKEHDPHSAPGLLQVRESLMEEEVDSSIHSYVMLVLVGPFWIFFI